jgi:hypothetical protein
MAKVKAERIDQWEKRSGASRPKIGALFGLATGGSHFVLHKLQGHPQVMALKQRALFPEVKHYFGEGSVQVADIVDKQLRPKKEDLAGVEWIFVNKPQMAYLSNQYLFNRERISNIYCLRNPMALFHSRANDRMAFGKQVYDRELKWEDIAESLVTEYRVSMASFAQAFDPKLDLVINLESFAANLQDHLDMIWGHLGVEKIMDSDLALLDTCEKCGRPLSVKEGQVGTRFEELLYCEHDQLYYQGPGGYNYIRKFNLSGLHSWKQKDHAAELTAYFSDHLGSELMAFFQDEAYMGGDARERFGELIDNTMAGFLT